MVDNFLMFVLAELVEAYLYICDFAGYGIHRGEYPAAEVGHRARCVYVLGIGRSIYCERIGTECDALLGDFRHLLFVSAAPVAQYNAIVVETFIAIWLDLFLFE